MLQVSLHKSQLEVARDDHRFRIIDAGRRWGKSTLARLQLLKWATTTKGLYWLVSPTYVQSKQNHWSQLQQEVPKAWIAKMNHSELSITLHNGSVIMLKGAENPDSLRGVGLRGLVIDEIASIRNWYWLWEEVLRPTLTDFSAPCIFISTPKGFNHFYDLYMKGQNEDVLYKSWKFTSYDNPNIPPSEIDAQKKELSEDAFEQEYLASFRKATGLAFKPWNREIHLIAPFDVPKTWNRARGFDYGSANPTASVRCAIDPDWNWFVERCYLDSRRSIEEHAKAILSQDFGYDIIPAWGDPSGAQWFKEFEHHNLYIEPADKTIKQGMRGWVEHGVEKINNLLMPVVGHTVILPDGRKFVDAPKLFVLDIPENQAFVKQMELLRWRETSAGETLPVLDESGDTSVPDGHFDLMAALRYLVVSYAPPIPYVKNDFTKWAI